MSSTPCASRSPAVGKRRAAWAALLQEPRPLIMGVVNITPDSFSDGGRFFEHRSALDQAWALAAAGADILDLGGESTRPFAEPVSLEEELRRVIPVIQNLAAEVNLPISIDTYKAPVARAALEAGASVINDISALRFDPEMAPLAAAQQVPVVLMHMQGNPRDMQVEPHYDDLLGEIKAFFKERLEFAASQGLDRELLVLDPGIGFGKTFQHNLEILNHLDEFLELGCPLMVGPSRKAFIGRILDLPNGEVRDIGTLAALGVAVTRGARIIRTHNAAYARQFLAVLTAIQSGELPPAAPAAGG
ncbi:MAG: dihydropteroate synthase [Syntrophales bacterium]|nr:dihydropteroate synthase [Syntrophales bacterium]MDD5641550.1 dihydropteroate synthase [Syntrophales bacterium]